MESSNAAMMREALLIVKRLFDGRIMFQPAIRKAHKAVDAALAKPPRNCDIFKTESERQSAFIAYYNEAFDLKGTSGEISICDLKHDVDGILHEYIEWLFATATEQEGEADGAK